MDHGERTTSPWLAVVYGFVVIAALVAAFFAFATYWFACHGDVHGGGCPDGDPTLTMLAQLAAPALGLAAIAATALYDLNGRRSVARRLLLAALVLFAAWALFADAAVHGWDNLHLLP